MLLLDSLTAVGTRFVGFGSRKWVSKTAVPDDTAIQGYKTPEAIGFTEVNLCFAACAFSYQQKRIGVKQETANAEDNEALDLHREARREGQWQEVREKKGYADAAKSRGSDSCFDRLISSLEGLSGREIKVERSTTNTLRPLVI
ncbi:uncharacterized protein BO96DRAFT_353000 [Aspergillus niger CBS 101883]|uniref:Uncharacterized protein n=2 Tax=Aspergillus niger TaxID=5061 RepID=A2QUB2_ASPNC|nr:uncharacterized protein BO96DRAFT_353000 [Aspergillus niger CBS 101883]XP_059601428.1 hypothetical protein An09g05020 [Aspergillus niger]PYH50246.1 hypothetical protein BO96DRAFT_353000 [Aspergillus niger CBS 101883]CAK40355.1 hypothetical protein An09g05020 [Aspergillus niger]